MYDYGYGNDYTTAAYDATDASLTGGIMGFFAAYSLAFTVVGILMIVCMWRIFTKAGKPGWASIIPIYNIIVLLQIVELPLWYIVLFFIPFANIYAIFKIYIELAHKFGKSTGFGVASVFFSIICLPILAFSKCTYNGQAADSSPAEETVQPVVDTNQVNAAVVPENTSEVVQSETSEPAVEPESIDQLTGIQPINENSPAENEPVSTKKCPYCGKELPIDATFCDGCNKQI